MPPNGDLPTPNRHYSHTAKPYTTLPIARGRPVFVTNIRASHFVTGIVFVISTGSWTRLAPAAGLD